MPWMQGLPRYTVTYCQYGYRYMKPTDIWTNARDPCFKPPCSPGDPCHEAAPRGARTGMQATCSKADRARIPPALCDHVVDVCEREVRGTRLFDWEEVANGRDDRGEAPRGEEAARS